MEKAVTEDLTDDEIQDLVDDIKDAYGVDDDAISNVEVTYDVDGEMDVTVPDGVTDSELEEFLETELADILGIPKSDVDVTIDPETGDVTYTIKNDSVDAASDIQDQLNDPATIEELNRRLDEAYPGAEITNNVVDDEIDANVDVTVDTTDATNDSETAGDSITDSQGANGWDVNTDGKLSPCFCNFLFLRCCSNCWTFNKSSYFYDIRSHHHYRKRRFDVSRRFYNFLHHNIFHSSFAKSGSNYQR